jgi:hypothetical protein
MQCKKKCPLWVKSRHVRCNEGCPLSAISGHQLIQSLRRHERPARRNGEAEQLGRLEVDDQFKFGGLKNRKLSRLCTLKDTRSVQTSLAIHVENAASVGCLGPPASLITRVTSQNAARITSLVEFDDNTFRILAHWACESSLVATRLTRHYVHKPHPGFAHRAFRLIYFLQWQFGEMVR